MLDNGFGTNEYPRDQANAALTWFASENHETKFGIDWQEVKWLQDVRRQTFYSGPTFSATQGNTATQAAATRHPAASAGRPPGLRLLLHGGLQPGGRARSRQGQR